MPATSTKRAEVVAEDEDVAQRFRDYLKDLHFDVQVRPRIGSGFEFDVDLVIYHVPRDAMDAERRQTVRPSRAAMGFSRFWTEVVQQISQRAPSALILVAVAPGEETADRALDSGATDVIEETITPKIFRRRIEMLEAFRSFSFARATWRTHAPQAPRNAPAALELPLPELRNARSGRIDAQAVAAYLGIPLRRLAEAVGLKYAGIHKTPDSPRAHDALRPIVRVLELANRAFGSGETVRHWLNRPVPELEDASPLAVILAGEADAVETLIRNALTGIPV